MYYFIVNPYAHRGRGGRLWKKIERCLRRFGVDYEAVFTEKCGDARTFAHQLTAGSGLPRILVAVGGGGTVNEVVDGLVFDAPVTLGYIPTGTANDLARGLKISRNWKNCLKKVIKSKYYKLLDYGILSYEDEGPVYRRFIISCGIGMDAAVCHSMLEGRPGKRWRNFAFGRLRYMFHCLRQWWHSRSARGYIVLDGVKRVEFNHIYFISTHIHPYEAGGFCFAPHADGGDGLLEVCVAHSTSKILLFSLLFRAWLRKNPRYKGIRRYSCRELRIHVDRPMPVHVDGESCFCQTDIDLNCVAGKVRTFV